MGRKSDGHVHAVRQAEPLFCVEAVARHVHAVCDSILYNLKHEDGKFQVSTWSRLGVHQLVSNSLGQIVADGMMKALDFLNTTE
jgi:hypothetical protein